MVIHAMSQNMANEQDGCLEAAFRVLLRASTQAQPR